MLVASACRRDDGASDSPASASPGSAQPAAELRDAEQRRQTTTTLTLDDISPISERTVVLEDRGAPFAVVDAGKPKTIFSAPYVELAGAGPLTNDRVMVRVKTGHGLEDTTVEAHLLDLDSGSVAQFVAVSDWQAPKFGLTYVWIMSEGREARALLHAREGVVVPLGAADQRGMSEVHVHPVLGDGWVFAPNPRDPAAVGKYAHWKDLRELPPAPDRDLPFEVWRGTSDPWNRRADDELMVRVRMPGSNDPRGGDPVIAALGDPEDRETCRRAELRPDGSAPCIDYVQSLADGWRVGVEGEEPVFTNDETGQVQRLALSELCGAFSEGDIPTFDTTHISPSDFSYDPPRMLLECREAGFEILWSPERTVRVPHVGDRQARRYGWWSRGHELRTFAVMSDDRDQIIHDHWVDLADLELVHTPGLANVAGHLGRRTTLVTPAHAVEPVWLLDFDADLNTRIMEAKCVSIAAEQGRDDGWVIGCEGAREVLRWVEVVRPSSRTRVRLPGVGGPWGHRAWVTADGQRAIGIVRRNGKDLVQTWKLR
ncbi:MAG: hypothetical protein IAG13_04475 [Deltaproteobacteria bacterium]|nr:hypothetical protein [Nannocystaceae bacterium]